MRQSPFSAMMGHARLRSSAVGLQSLPLSILSTPPPHSVCMEAVLVNLSPLVTPMVIPSRPACSYSNTLRPLSTLPVLMSTCWDVVYMLDMVTCEGSRGGRALLAS